MSTESTQERRQRQYRQWIGSLSPATQCQLDESATAAPADEEGGRPFDELRQHLSPAARQTLDGNLPEDESELPEGRGLGFCMIECEEGEFPALRIFRTLNGLVERIRSQDGKDIVVWPFLGIPLPFSKGPNRVLLLPSDKAITISETQTHVELREEDLEIQEDGFLGPPELSIAAPSYINEDEAREEAMSKAGEAVEEPSGDDEEEGELPDPV